MPIGGIKRDKILHGEALGQFNKFVELRQQRLNSVESSLPAMPASPDS